jgi:hypothetical protein
VASFLIVSDLPALWERGRGLLGADGGIDYRAIPHPYPHPGAAVPGAGFSMGNPGVETHDRDITPLERYMRGVRFRLAIHYRMDAQPLIAFSMKEGSYKGY